MIMLVPLILLLTCLPAVGAELLPPYAVAVRATPVLNRPDFHTGLTSRDRCGQLRAVEFIALPGTAFTIRGEEKREGSTVYRVTTEDYPYPGESGYFVDSRDLRPQRDKPPERQRSLPSRAEIIARMKQRLGSGYVWGGNVAEGVRPAAREGETLLAGLDCSGLLYEATGGYTPRNTSSLVSYGREVGIAGKDGATLAAELLPLDLIVWPGHVLMVIDNNMVIESRLVCGNPREGVRIRPLRQVLADIMATRRPVNTIGKGKGEFVVRRWYGE
jgi:cell wall-associated NlpC family hydrolase